MAGNAKVAQETPKPVAYEAYQQLHKGCGGAIAVIAAADGARVQMFCVSCKAAWDIQVLGANPPLKAPPDWEGYLAQAQEPR